MFNIWPFNNSKNIIDSMPKWEWVSNTGYTIDGKFYTPVELVNEFIKLKDEKKNLEDVLKSIEEDGTVEHNNAIKLRRENVELKNELNLVEIEQEAILAANHDMAQTLKETNDRVILLENALDRWSTKAKGWEKLDEELKSNISELTKEVLHLRHLKTENVKLIEYTKNLREQQNFLYKENVELIERIKKLEEDISKYKNGNSDWSRLYESACKDRTDLENKLDFEQKKYQILDHNYQGCTKYRDEYKHQLDAANKEIEALKSKLRDYQDKYAQSFSYHDMNGSQKEIDDLKLMYKERETKLKTYNTSLLGQIAGLKEENEKLKNDIVDYVFDKTEEQKHPMYPIHWGTLDPDIYEKAKNISIEEAIKDVVKAEVENKETTAENLEEKFDRGEDVMDYFKKNTEKSWEETASDLALRVAKLEKKIEELTIAK
jgi:chromosome segregation ATPase